MQLIRTHRALGDAIYSIYNVSPPMQSQNCILQDETKPQSTPVQEVSFTPGQIQAVNLLNKFNDFMNNDVVYIVLISVIIISIILLLCILNHRTYKILKILETK